MRTIIRERVERGVTLLDDNVPGWRDRVDPVRLDVTDAFRCILGQVFDEGEFATYAGFWIGIRELGLHDEILIADGRMIEATEHYGFTFWRDQEEEVTAEWLRHLSHSMAIA